LKTGKVNSVAKPGIGRTPTTLSPTFVSSGQPAAGICSFPSSVCSSSHSRGQIDQKGLGVTDRYPSFPIFHFDLHEGSAGMAGRLLEEELGSFGRATKATFLQFFFRCVFGTGADLEAGRGSFRHPARFLAFDDVHRPRAGYQQRETSDRDGDETPESGHRTPPSAESQPGVFPVNRRRNPIANPRVGDATSERATFWRTRLKITRPW
jgi:hypothetical protein